MKCCMCGFELEYNYYHLCERGLVFCSIECLKDNNEERYEGTLPVKATNMTFGDAINKLKEGYVRRRDGQKYFIKLNNDVWEEFK